MTGDVGEEEQEGLEDSIGDANVNGIVSRTEIAISVTIGIATADVILLL